GTSVPVKVSRTGALTTAVSVDVTLGGSASQSDDYTVSGFDTGMTINFAAGDSSRTLSFALVADGRPEPGGETILLGLSNPGGGAPVESPHMAAPNVRAGAIFEFSDPSPLSAEGGATLTLAVSRSGPGDVRQSVQVAPAAGGTAVEGQDFNLLDLGAGH